MSTVDLRNILIKTLEDLGGSSKILPICRHAWTKYLSNQISPEDDLFYTWQYRIRWEARDLRKAKIMNSIDDSPYGIWQLSSFKKK